MVSLWPFSRPSPGKQLRQLQLDRWTERKRAKVDEMRSAMGKPPINWKTMKVE